MIETCTFLIMVAVAYAYWREGVFPAFCMCVSVVVAGVIAFNFWEPLASLLEGLVRGTMLAGFEDFFCLLALFAVPLAGLRLAVNSLAPLWIEYPPALQQFGGAALGLVMGYLITGFLLCLFQTMPWHENFMGFQPRGSGESPFRSLLPPDRVWLAMMRHAGAYPLAATPRDNPGSDSPYDAYMTFDRDGSFELRYRRYRRYNDERDPIPYLGEYDRELQN